MSDERGRPDPGRTDAEAETEGPVSELSYRAASSELESIVEYFEKSDVDVDQLVAKLERATAIVDELDRRIRRTRAQVEELVPKLEAVGRDADADGDTDSDESGGESGDVAGALRRDAEDEQLF
ncbi:MAG: exodeoxyribonuclease VII small subunit [Acidimicrobiales bacterium]